MTQANVDAGTQAAALRALALGHFNGHRHAEAARAYERSLELEPGHFDALLMLGTIAAHQAAPVRAAQYFQAAIAVNPDSAVAHMNLGLVRSTLGELALALDSFDTAVVLDPSLAEAHCNRGVALERLERPTQALAAYERAIELDPRHVRAHNNRASVLLALGRPEAAIAGYDAAIVLAPGLSRSHSKRGVALMELKQPAAALDSFARAIALDRANAEAYWNAALCNLLIARYDEGWRLYEWRKRLPEPIAIRPLAAPLWTGKQAIAGRSIYVYAEQGLGDTLQFCRYALALQAAGARVVLGVQRALRRLIARLDERVSVIDVEAPVPVTDFHSPLLSLPLAFRTRASAEPAAVPYLAAGAEEIVRWRERIGTHGLRVGIAWAGNATHLDLGRFYPLGALAPLAAIPGVRLISLQKGRGTEQLQPLPDGLRVETLGEDFDAGPDAFIDSAAVLGCLDVLVTPDTALAHLAGALGRPAWVLLKEVPDWRWGLDADSTAWYPTLRLFRQPRRGDWDSAIRAVATALAALPRPLT